MSSLPFLRPPILRRLHCITPVSCLLRWSVRGQTRKFTCAMREVKLAKATVQKRPPIVSVMGHVNHGKTSLLDYLRSTQVAEKEAGGITQHIGAFSVLLDKQPVTFLDTPGHEAFSVLRSRGAKLTDLIVLVIAVDDGVQPQTIEVIELSHKMKVPLIVAVNKIDRGVGTMDKVLHQLLHHNVQVEQLGGDTQAISISAITGENINNLLESILAQAELLDLKADYSGPVEAVVVESKMTKGLGPTASIIIQQGTLKIGDNLYGSSSWARVRAMRNEAGKPVKLATPGMPVFTMGWKELPNPGEVIVQEKKPSYSSLNMEDTSRNNQQTQSKADDSFITVPLIVKGDTIGSVESLVSVLTSLDQSKASLNVVLTGIGDVTEGDLKIAQSINGIVLGFSTANTKTIDALAEKYKVDVLTNDVIYRLLEQLKDHVEKLLPSVEEEEMLGEAEVFELFKLTGAKKAYVAGCKVHHGYLMKDKIFKIIRNDKVIFQGDVSSIKHHQNDVFKISHGTECGLGFDKKVDIQPGDTIQCIAKIDVVQKLDWNF